MDNSPKKCECHCHIPNHERTMFCNCKCKHPEPKRVDTNEDWESTDKFVEMVELTREWFKREELEVSDYVLGHMAKRVQELMQETLQKRETDILQKIKGLRKKEIIGQPESYGYNQALDDAIALLQEGK